MDFEVQIDGYGQSEHGSKNQCSIKVIQELNPIFFSIPNAVVDAF